MMRSLLVLLSCIGAVYPLDNGLALTPPMGWLDWERYRCNTNCKEYPNDCISERLFMRMADLMVSEGYKDAGYDYVNIDDCWPAKQRDSEGRLQPDPDRFPSGMKNLSNYMHERGLKLGIYEDFGTKTCAGYPGSEFYMQLDAQSFADWGVDMLKFDGCNSHIDDMAYGYPLMAQYLNKTGAHIVYSCEWALENVLSKLPNDYAAIRKACNLWRNYDDVGDSWDSVVSTLRFYGDDLDNFSSFAGAGGWNDPDMIIVGDYGLSYDQQRAQMAMWAIMASPLFMSVDLANVRNESKALLQNRRIIAVNQDKLGVQGVRVLKMNDVELWVKPILPSGSCAFALLNFASGGGPRKVILPLDSLKLTGTYGFNITETIDGKDSQIYKLTESITVFVNPTGVYMATAVPLTRFGWTLTV